MMRESGSSALGSGVQPSRDRSSSTYSLPVAPERLLPGPGREPSRSRTQARGAPRRMPHTFIGSRRSGPSALRASLPSGRRTERRGRPEVGTDARRPGRPRGASRARPGRDRKSQAERVTTEMNDATVIGTALRPPGHRRDDRVPEPLPARERLVHGRGLEPAVDHAVLALRVAALPPVVFPARRLQELLEALGVPFLQQVAGALPAEHVEGWVPPGRALVVALPHEELEEERRLVEPPAALGVREDPGEQL